MASTSGLVWPRFLRLGDVAYRRLGVTYKRGWHFRVGFDLLDPREEEWLVLDTILKRERRSLVARWAGPGDAEILALYVLDPGAPTAGIRGLWTVAQIDQGHLAAISADCRTAVSAILACASWARPVHNYLGVVNFPVSTHGAPEPVLLLTLDVAVDIAGMVGDLPPVLRALEGSPTQYVIGRLRDDPRMDHGLCIRPAGEFPCDGATLMPVRSAGLVQMGADVDVDVHGGGQQVAPAVGPVWTNAARIVETWNFRLGLAEHFDAGGERAVVTGLIMLLMVARGIADALQFSEVAEFRRVAIRNGRSAAQAWLAAVDR